MLKKSFKNILSASVLVSALTLSSTISNASTYKVFIDPGHGGKDNGSSYNGYLEDNINLQISKKLASKLTNEGIDVEISRNDDTYLSLRERAFMSNNSNADLFISIHQNASLNKNANGIETYYLKNHSKSLANAIHQNVIDSTNANNRKVKIGNFQVLRDNNKPSILLECGFISNPIERYKLSTSDYQEKLVNGVVNGVKEYLNISTSNNTSSTSNKDYSYRYAYVLNTVNVMSDRGKNFSVIGTLPQGTKVKVIDTKFDWHKIEYNGRYGYVSGVYVK